MRFRFDRNETNAYGNSAIATFPDHLSVATMLKASLDNEFDQI